MAEIVDQDRAEGWNRALKAMLKEARGKDCALEVDKMVKTLAIYISTDNKNAIMGWKARDFFFRDEALSNCTPQFSKG